MGRRMTVANGTDDQPGLGAEQEVADDKDREEHENGNQRVDADRGWQFDAGLADKAFAQQGRKAQAPAVSEQGPLPPGWSQVSASGSQTAAPSGMPASNGGDNADPRIARRERRRQNRRQPP